MEFPERIPDQGEPMKAKGAPIKDEGVQMKEKALDRLRAAIDLWSQQHTGSINETHWTRSPMVYLVFEAIWAYTALRPTSSAKDQQNIAGEIDLPRIAKLVALCLLPYAISTAPMSQSDRPNLPGGSTSAVGTPRMIGDAALCGIALFAEVRN